MIRPMICTSRRTAFAAGLVALLLAFPAAAAPAAIARPATPDTTSESLLYVREVVVGRSPCVGCPPRACVTEPVPVIIRGAFPNACYRFVGLRELPVAAAFPVLQADIVYEGCSGGCPDAEIPFTGSAELPPPGFPGTHSFLLIERVTGCPDSLSLISSRSRMITYEVVHPCVPEDSLVRSLVRFEVVPERRCSGDSLTLLMVKNGCPPCVDLTSLGFDIEGHLSASLNWRPNCLEFACIPETLSTPLGAFAAGHHEISVAVDVHVLLAPAPDSTVSFVAPVAFDVPASCDTTSTPCMPPYLRAGFLREAGAACALTVEPGHTATLGLSVVPTVPLGGLQGLIECAPPFRIVRATAPEGMDDVFVFSSPEGRGIRYVVITDLRNAIPPVPGPIMKLEIAADPGALPGARGSLFPLITLASDVNGDSVALCPVRRVDAPLIPLCVAGDATQCDANGDGHGDVRDLVLMAHCFRNTPAPPDSAHVCRDCNGDSVFTIADIVCCARHILRGPPMPRDSVHADARLSVRFDAPQTVPGAMYVTARVRGVRSLSAVLVHLKYPAGRWQASLPIHAASTAGGDIGLGGWISLIDPDEPGFVHLGGIRVANEAEDEIVFDMMFTAIAPQPGDRIEVEGADLGSPDGVVLTPNGALPTLTLDAPQSPPGPTLALSPARPNPFTTSTTFSVRLPASALVDLAVHDLAGRRVATIAHATYEAGEHPFTWSGAGAHDGVYFVRLTVNGQVLSTRVAMLKDSR